MLALRTANATMFMRNKDDCLHSNEMTAGTARVTLPEVFTEVEATNSSDVGEPSVLVDKTASVVLAVKTL